MISRDCSSSRERTHTLSLSRCSLVSSVYPRRRVTGFQPRMRPRGTIERRLNARSCVFVCSRETMFATTAEDRWIPLNPRGIDRSFATQGTISGTRDFRFIHARCMAAKGAIRQTGASIDEATRRSGDTRCVDIARPSFRCSRLPSDLARTAKPVVGIAMPSARRR